MNLTLEVKLILHTDAGFDAERRIWNGSIDRRPAAIAQVRSATDIATVLKQGGPVSVRCGGHSSPGHSVIEGAVMIDLNQNIRVDP